MKNDREWSGTPDPNDPDNFWINDATKLRVCAHCGAAQLTPDMVELLLATITNARAVAVTMLDEMPIGSDNAKHEAAYIAALDRLVAASS